MKHAIALVAVLPLTGCAALQDAATVASDPAVQEAAGTVVGAAASGNWIAAAVKLAELGGAIYASWLVTNKTRDRRRRSGKDVKPA